MIVISSLRATGDVGFPIQMAVLSMWCVWVPLAWLLGLKLGLGLAGIWIAHADRRVAAGPPHVPALEDSGAGCEHAERSRAHVTEATDSFPAV